MLGNHTATAACGTAHAGGASSLRNGTGGAPPGSEQGHPAQTGSGVLERQPAAAYDSLRQPPEETLGKVSSQAILLPPVRPADAASRPAGSTAAHSFSAPVNAHRDNLRVVRD